MTRHEFPTFPRTHHCALWRFGTAALAVAVVGLSAPAAALIGTASAAIPGSNSAVAAGAAVTAAMAAGCPTPAADAVYRSSPTFARTVALTIDDGPSASWTPQVLDILKANHIGATFFVIGENVRENPAMIRRALAEGSEIGNHTDTHVTLKGLSAFAQGAQMDAGRAAIMRAGGPDPCFFRAPGGNYDATTLALARARGMSLVQWSNDPVDWAAPSSLSPSYQTKIFAGAVSPVFDHPIVLLHDGSQGNYRQNTVNTLQRIIDSYRSRGYVFTDPLGRSLDHIGDPVSHLDSATSPEPGTVRVAGWAFDPSVPLETMRVHVYVNGVGHSISTGSYRPDVHRAYPQASDHTGFAVKVSAAAGLDPVCVYAINKGLGSNVLIGGGCRTVRVANPNPVGHLDRANSPGAGLVRVAGWAFDPSAPTQPLSIHVYVNGVGYARTTGVSRPDVQRAHPVTTDHQGFALTLPAPTGSDTVCVYAIDIGEGTNQRLGCPTVVVPPPPPSP
ncbi:polysaccharide deacetylase family protein [Nakamurella sp. GG22]